MNVPLRVAARLKDHRGVVLLHSGRDDDGCGRWSFAACDPVIAMQAQGREITLFDRTGAISESHQGDPLDMLQSLVRRHSAGWADDAPGPVPVAMGYIGYDVGRMIERLPQRGARAVDDVPDLWFGLYDAVWRYDARTGQSMIVGRDAGCKRDLAESIARGEDRIGPMPRLGALVPYDAIVGNRVDEAVGTEAYRKRVERALEYIRAGDVYQVNLARRLVADIQELGDPLALYAALARTAPAPFGAFVAIPGMEGPNEAYIVSGSPERFLAREPGSMRLETRPIKGTRKRTGDAARDRELARELAEDEKERAEHMMIVDLERNDLGRVAESGTVVVEAQAQVVELPNLYHLVSRVACELKSGVGLAEVLRATFPGGSITGAPKVRAMEIIDELEPTRRGPYTGAIGYVGLKGALDLSIAIRTALVTSDKFILHVGGGIVADSTPERELEETEEKAAGWRAALQ